jgi:hypothetical protein
VQRHIEALLMKLHLASRGQQIVGSDPLRATSATEPPHCSHMRACERERPESLLTGCCLQFCMEMDSTTVCSQLQRSPTPGGTATRLNAGLLQAPDEGSALSLSGAYTCTVTLATLSSACSGQAPTLVPLHRSAYLGAGSGAGM